MRHPTAHDVAQAASVSQSTVSIVFSGKWQGRVSRQTADRVKEAAAELGYRSNIAARNLRTGKYQTILMVIPVLSNPFFAEVHASAVRVAAQHELNVIVYPLDTDDEAPPLPSVRHAVDGILGCSVDAARLENIVGDLPFVVIDAEPSEAVPYVNADVGAGMTEAIEHLADRGHTHIGHLAISRDTWTFRRRAEEFQSSCRRMGLRWTSVSVPPGLESARSAASLLLSTPSRPSAVICDNDLLTVPLYSVAAELELSIPADIAVVGFDNSPLSRILHPPLTSIHISGAELGAIGAAMLIKRIAGENPSPQQLPITLIARASTEAG